MLEEVSARQAGVVSRRQALAAWLTDEAIAVRLHTGRWRRLHPGVYATFSGPVPRVARLWAALLYVGAGAMLSHQSAAELVGLSTYRDTDGFASEIHVTIPAERRVRQTRWLTVHRSRRAAEIAHPARQPPQTRVEETVLDLAESARALDDAIGWLARACGGRLTTPARLVEALAARKRVRWRVELLSAVEDVRSGCHSLLELRYLRSVERKHALPTGTRQRSRSRGGGRWYDDVCYESYRTLVELDGRAAHPDESRWRDMHRDNGGVADGLSVLRYGTATVIDRPCEVAVQVARVLAGNGWPGRPRPCGPDCPVRSFMSVETLPRQGTAEFPRLEEAP